VASPVLILLNSIELYRSLSSHETIIHTKFQEILIYVYCFMIQMKKEVLATHLTT